MANWEDALISDTAGDEEETPIFTALYLEYRETAFRRMAVAAKEQFEKDSKKEDENEN